MIAKRLPNFILGGLVLIIGFSAVPAGSATPIREMDPVVVPGSLLRALDGETLDRLGLFAWGEDQFLPIPFQIDERTEWDQGGSARWRVYVGESGAPGLRDDQPGLDLDDELCFLARDAGDRALPSLWPAEVRRGIEIALSDPLRQGQAFVYLFSFPRAAPRSPRRYLEYDPALDRIVSPAYQAGFDPKAPVTLEELSIPESHGGNSRDFLDAFQIRIDLLITPGVYGHVLHNQDFPGKILGVKAGPVRVIRIIQARGEVWPFYFSAPVFQTIHYPEAFEYEMEFKVPLAQGRLDLAADLNSSASGMTFYSAHNPQGVVVDGAMSEAEKNLDYSPGSWAAVTGQPGSLLLREVLPQRAEVFPDLLFWDDASAQDPPESEAGRFGRFGFSISPVQDLKPLPALVQIWFFFPPGQEFRPGQESPFLQIHDHPLQVETADQKGLGQVQAPPLPADTRPPGQAARKSFQTRSMTEEKTAGVLPWFLIDPNLGNGGGASYVDRDFMGQGIDLNVGGLISTRLYKTGDLEVRFLPWLKGVENFGFRVYYLDHPNRYYYGEGADADEDDLSVYRRTEQIAELKLEKYWRPSFGTFFQWQYHQVQVGPGEMVMGELPSIEEHYGRDSELDQGERWGPRVYGYGISKVNHLRLGAYWDRRDNERYPRQGSYWKGQVEWVDPWLGADYRYLKNKAQVSAYFSPHWLNLETQPLDHPGPLDLWGKFAGPDKSRVLAFRFTLQDIQAGTTRFAGREISDVPFFELSELGDKDLMRGCYEARQRGNDLVDFQTELRWLAYKDTLHLFLFLDAGRVFDDLWAPSEDVWDQQTWLISYGAGVIVHTLPDYLQRITIGFSREVFAIIYVTGWYAFEDKPRQKAGDRSPDEALP